MATEIEWTQMPGFRGDVWNFIAGCNDKSPGCENCYARGMSHRLAHIPMMGAKYQGVTRKSQKGRVLWTGQINVHEEVLVKPFKARKPTMYFVNSMSDLFHDNVPFEVVRKAFGVMASCEGHIFQILTKRPQRALDFFNWMKENDPDMQNDPAHEAYDLCVEYGIETGCGSAFETGNWPLENVWIGVSVENQATADERIPLLLQLKEQGHASLIFLSMEPLIEPVDLHYPKTIWPNGPEMCCSGRECGCHGLPSEPYLMHGVDWVIVGGESGAKARPMHPLWASSLRNQCEAAGVPFFFKQWGKWGTRMESMTERIPVFRMYHDYQHFTQKDWVEKGDACIDMDGKLCLIGGDFQTAKYPVAIMSPVGKHAAGKLLDGKEYLNWPAKKTI